MALRGLQVLYNLILKDIVKGSGQASGIMSIGKDVRKLADRKLQSYITAAKRQGVDLDKLSEQELKYTLELNKPKPIRAIAADSPEGQGITRDLFNMLDRRSGKNVKWVGSSCSYQVLITPLGATISTPSILPLS